MRRDDRISPMGDSYAIVVFWMAACRFLTLLPRSKRGLSIPLVDGDPHAQARELRLGSCECMSRDPEFRRTKLPPIGVPQTTGHRLGLAGWRTTFERRLPDCASCR
jgi:hypothetical protein